MTHSPDPDRPRPGDDRHLTGQETGHDTDMVVAGAGPAGLALAIELGRRGVPVTVVDAGPRGGYKSPRTMLINDRSMEHLRRWGIADRLREDNPIDPELVPDVLFATTLNGWPLHRFVRPFVGEGRDDRIAERAQWIPQLRIEGTLREHAESLPSVRFLWDHTVTDVAETADRVRVGLQAPGGEPVSVTARYLAGCDGSHSVVRTSIGVRLEGRPHLLRAFKYHVVAPLKARTTAGYASFYWFVNASFGAGTSVLLNALDGEDGWGFSCYPVPEGVDGDDHQQVAQVLFAAVGEQVPVRFVSGRAWNMHAMVAPAFRVGRTFLAGDAAHLMPNLGGFGMNTSVLDAVDLGWKLAWVLRGWGGPHLLDSYDAERRPAVQWVLDQQIANASVLSADLYQAGIQDHGRDGDAARERVGAAIRRTKTAEFHSLGMQKGYRYDDSPVLVPDGTPPGPQDAVRYTPSARPGSVAPHRWLADGQSLYDTFGPELTLLVTGADGLPADVTAFEQAAQRHGIPLRTVRHDDPAVAAAYGAPLVLIRPDQHVAWRASPGTTADPCRILETVTGR